VFSKGEIMDNPTITPMGWECISCVSCVTCGACGTSPMLIGVIGVVAGATLTKD
jgi:hypothetical protein